MFEKAFRRYNFQILNHWGDPFYLNNNRNGFHYSLTKETWDYAKSRSKSIGILVKFEELDKTTIFPSCLTIYTSGKVINSSNAYSINLNKYLNEFMTDQMIKKLGNNEIHNNGRFLLPEELLFLVERGSLFLFSWDSFSMKWVQTSIAILFNLLLDKSFCSIKLSEYLSYSFTRRSGCNPLVLESTKDKIRTSKQIFQVIDCKEYLTNSYKRNSSAEKATESTNSNFHYSISILNPRSRIPRENQFNLISEQPHRYLRISEEMFGNMEGFIMSIISVNSEIKFKVSIPEL